MDQVGQDFEDDVAVSQRRGLPRRLAKVSKVFGPVGWFFKGLIYAIIGVLSCLSVVSGNRTNESPQGVFILFGEAPSGSGVVLLIVVFIGIVMYSLWRFGEAFFGQGYTSEFGRLKNFFRWRLSPFISGIVYAVYGAFIVELLVDLTQDNEDGSDPRENDFCFPKCWKDTAGGLTGIFFVSLALFIGFVTQIIPVFTGSFMNEMHSDITRQSKRLIYWTLNLLGRIGFFGRALLFLLVSIAIILVFAGINYTQDSSQHTLAQALSFYTEYTIGKLALFLMGMCLVAYGVYAILCCKFRSFPTRYLS